MSLTRSGLICTPAVVSAFSKVDRGHFIDPPEDSAEEVRYINSPLRNGKQHLSAPCIYATALEALELSVGCSFLNVCAGTGYFSALASQILGNKAVHHAIEIKEELVEHARQKLFEIGCSNVELYTGACQALSPETSMRFDRIYLGAGADEAMASLLFRMLEIGGVLVGPFAGADGSQRLLQAHRLDDASYEVRELMHVQFTPILPPTLAAANSSAQELPIAPPLAPPVGPPLPEDPQAQAHPSFSTEPSASRCGIAAISLAPPSWCTANYDRFPSAHRAAVRTLLLIHAKADSLLSTLPKDVLLHEVLPQLGYSSFAAVQVALEPPATPSSETGKGKAQRKARGKAQHVASQEQAEDEDRASEESRAEDSENESERSHGSEGSASETERSRSSSEGTEDGDEAEVPSGTSAHRHAAITSHARRGWNRLLRCF